MEKRDAHEVKCSMAHGSEIRKGKKQEEARGTYDESMKQFGYMRFVHFACCMSHVQQWVGWSRCRREKLAFSVPIKVIRMVACKQRGQLEEEFDFM